MAVINLKVVAVTVVSLVVLGSVLKSLGWFSLSLWRLEIALGGDKMTHLIFSYLCTIALLFGFCRFGKAHRERVRRFILLLILVFAVDENLQRFIPTREFSWTDLISNLFGILCALTSWLLLHYLFLLKQKKEQQHGLR
ncbi:MULTISPECIES: VanZ family protein [unclassified Agarivorans]|uniref:VanZ family protein n=1 Tax=unclassified Agarivorans TaxID=2636026 RepID=UPI003D7E1051